MIRRFFLLVWIMLAGCACQVFADSCTITSTAPIVFGSMSGAAIRVTGTITFQCSQGSAFSIGLSAGTTSGATVTDRRMSGAGTTLGYSLFSDASYFTNWGNTGGTGLVSGTATGASQTVTVYAQLPAGQNPPAGSYSDTVTATISGNFPSSSMQLSISATVAKACTVSASSLNFGNYMGSPLNSVAAITATCTNGTAYQIGLDAGTAPGATVTHRSMIGPSSVLLNYNLYSDSSRSVNWGNTLGTDTVGGTGSGNAQALTVYGQIPSGQTTVVAGNYSDTVTVTLTY